MHLNAGNSRPAFSRSARGRYFIFSTLLQVIIFSTGYGGINGIRDSLLFSSLWRIPVFLFPERIKIIAAVVGIILWTTSLTALCYYFIYSHEFSQSVLFAMFETNASEAGEYFSLKLLFITRVY
ncbi:TPA: hypothetical protein N6536_005324, partial [Escherichia coli]|nr:hypothetical protein [Escherichia coli]